jgi:hypothetical protein
VKLSRLLDRRWLWPALVLAVAFALRALYGPGPGGERPAVHSETSLFDVFLAGDLLGREEVTYQEDASGKTVRLTTASELTTPYGAMTVSSEADFTVPDFTLTRYRATNSGMMCMAEFTLERREGGFIFTTTGSAEGRKLELAAPPNTVLLDNNIAGHYQLLARRWKAIAGSGAPFPVVVPQAGKLFEATLTPGGERQGELSGRRVLARGLQLAFGSLKADLWVAEETGDLLDARLHGKQEGEYLRVGFHWLDEGDPSPPE